MATRHRSVLPKIPFVIIIIAALLQFYTDSPLLFNFMFNIIPETFNYNLFYFIIGLLFVVGIILLNGHFSTPVSSLVNAAIIVGTIPYAFLSISEITNLELVVANVNQYMIFEPLLYLAILGGVLFYYFRHKAISTILLAISFGLLFITITVFHLMLYASMDHYHLTAYIDYILGAGITISSIGIVGCSVYLIFSGEKDLKQAHYQSSNFEESSSKGNNERGKACKKCQVVLKEADRFCPHCGTHQ